MSVDCSVEIGEAYELYRDTTVTAGNVDAVAVLARGDEAAVRGAVAACLRQVGDPCLRYILMPSCDLPVDTPLRNVAAFLAAADER
ncbi:MAG: uroporphyrinogen decarboxylase family protein [Candidatus Methylomirabilia bacterium]